MNETAIYIHIPFCDHKCIYCDFYSIINYDNVSSYLASLKTEINYYSKKFSNDRKIISIFFGGGTPSYMEPQYIQQIIDIVKENFFVADEAEITLETNPGTVDKEKLIEFKKSGINRISIGVQSFDDDELKFLTRIHNSETAVKTVRDSFESGIENISLDLIFNLPKQSKQKWLSNLEKAVALPIKHLSAYSLILEPGTILNKMVMDGKVKMQSEEHDADLYEMTIDFLTQNGYEQYEVSNFAKPGYQCIHNIAYWEYNDYIGFGTSAHSFVNGERWWNYSSLNFYNAAVKAKYNAVCGSEKLTDKQKLEEYVMLSLRSEGLDIDALKNRFDLNWFAENQKLITQLIEEKYLILTDSFLKLTPKGYAVCDEILTKIVNRD
ncbi:MAG: radical SAM family heme chaperone HemW [Ignavibacteria bacterium]|nr:radical SAM family heme chaperone HemW [Ignavibacteria bacterium]